MVSSALTMHRSNSVSAMPRVGATREHGPASGTGLFAVQAAAGLVRGPPDLTKHPDGH